MIKELRADGSVVEMLMRADVEMPIVNETSVDMSESALDGSSSKTSRNAKKCKYIDDKGKEIEMSKVSL